MIRDNYVIQQFHPNRFQGAEQIFRKKTVGFAGRSRSRGMIVSDNDRIGVGLHYAPYDRTDRWLSLINRTNGEQSILKQRSSSVQQECSEMLLGKAMKTEAQISRRFTDVFQHDPFSRVRKRHAPGNLHRRSNLRRLCSLQTFDIKERGNWRLSQSPERTELSEDLSRQFNCIGSLHSHAKQNGHNLSVGQRLRTKPQQTIARTFALWPGNYTFGFRHLRQDRVLLQNQEDFSRKCL